jgi:hypothetical protein
MINIVIYCYSEQATKRALIPREKKTKQHKHMLELTSLSSKFIYLNDIQI